MGETINVMAEPRHGRGKGASRRLRRAGMVPGIVYGGHGEPEMISVARSLLDRHLRNETFYSSLLDLTVGDSATQVVLKGVQRHPAKPLVLHIDFQRVSKGLKLRMTVPLHFENQQKSVGIRAGGKLSHQMTELDVLCLPEDLPEYIGVDIATMRVGDTLHVADLPLPVGVELGHTVDPHAPVATMHGGYGDAASDAPGAGDQSASALSEGSAAPEG